MMFKKIKLLYFLLVVGISPFVFVGLVDARMSNDPFATQWAYEDIGVYAAWDKAIGSREVIVAVIDNGFDTFHHDLKDNVWKNEDEISGNGRDDDGNGYTDDVWGWNFVAEDVDGDGTIGEKEELGNNDPRPNVSGLSDYQLNKEIFNHGTLVAGLIGAVGNNGRDGVGINWQVKLMNIKVIGNNGSGTFEKLDEAIYYAVDNGAGIINISMVGDYLPEELELAIRYAYNKGVVVVAAAGNGMYDLDFSPVYPICVSGAGEKDLVFGVSAIDEEHHSARFSNVGSDCVDITAPGVKISSTLRFSPTNGLTERYSGGWKGTSFATPLVSGAVALIKSIQPSWGPAEIFQALISTVHHTPSQDEEVYADYFGAGLLQIDKAVEYAFEKLENGVYSGGKRFEIISSAGMVVSETNWQKASTRLVVEGVDDIVSFQEKGKQFFVLAHKAQNENREIAFFNSDWSFVRAWTVPANGPVEIVVADINDDEKVEVAVVPAYSDNQAVSLFDKYGRELAEWSLEQKHQGVSIDLINKKGKDYIALLLNSGSGIQIYEMDENLKVVEKIAIDYPAPRGVLGTGDIDGDGEDEYVVGGYQGQVPRLGYYEGDGGKKRLFYSYDTSYLGGVSLGILDYNNDGKEDIITVPLGATEEVRVWNEKVKKLAQWKVFVDTVVQGLKVLVY